jgi:hypothetical protein
MVEPRLQSERRVGGHVSIEEGATWLAHRFHHGPPVNVNKPALRRGQRAGTNWRAVAMTLGVVSCKANMLRWRADAAEDSLDSLGGAQTHAHKGKRQSRRIASI